MFLAWQRGCASIIQVNAELDMVSRPTIESVILEESLFEKLIIVSLERCTFCDSAGLATFVKAKQRLGARLQIVVPLRSRVRRAFALSGLSQDLSLCETVDEAFARHRLLADNVPTVA